MKVNTRNVLISSIVLTLLLAIHFVTPTPGGLWLRTFYDSMHIPIFGMIAVGILYMTPKGWGSRQRFFSSLAIVALLAMISELAQVPTARDASLRDFASDILGGIGFMCIAMGLSPGFHALREGRSYLVLIGMASLAFPLAPLVAASASYVERAQSLPSLIRFDSRLSELRFKMRSAELIRMKEPTSGDVSAVILLGDGQWPGISLTDIWPDWEAYEALIIEIENPEVTNLPISIRIHDRGHRNNQTYNDRFNRRFDLVPGRQTFQIDLGEIRDAPVGRKMNMAEIDGLVLFTTRKQAGRRFVLHELRLVGTRTLNNGD
jgi:hypothetical protein